MNRYVMIFRSNRALSPEDSKKRAADIQAWVRQIKEMGVDLDPRNLGAVVAHYQADDSLSGDLGTNPTDPSLVTMVFFTAKDDEQAKQVAAIHPGPRYGVSLELRTWSPPGPPARP